MASRDLKRVAVILLGRVQYERNVLRGIRDYATECGAWLIRLELPGQHTLKRVQGWGAQGILFQAAGLSPPSLRELEALKLPAMHLSDAPRGFRFRHVGLDNREIGRVAARYYRDRQFRRFAFAGATGVRFSRLRGGAFAGELNTDGFEIATREWRGRGREGEILDWLRGLPKPVGLFATHDEHSLFLATLCREAGLRVPEEIAILGVDNDELICELAWPKLSSVSVPSRRVGFTAASRLDRLMEGEAGVESALLSPGGVVERHSTDVHQTEDEVVDRALRFMKSHLGRRINVEDVLREAGVSRRLLERKFQAQLGRSPLQEIQRLRVERAKQCLVEGGAPLQRIAAEVGCRDASQLVALFRRQCGLTPGQFRARAGVTSGDAEKETGGRRR